MNPFQIAGVAGGCVLALAGIVGLLATQGMPVTMAFLTVYAIALLTMLCLQRRARQSCDAEREAGSFERCRRPDVRDETVVRRRPERLAGLAAAAASTASTGANPRMMGTGEIGC